MALFSSGSEMVRHSELFETFLEGLKLLEASMGSEINKIVKHFLGGF